MHKDSPLSPFYQPSVMSEDRFRAMIGRSISRARYISSIISGTSYSDDDSDHGYSGGGGGGVYTSIASSPSSSGEPSAAPSSAPGPSSNGQSKVIPNDGDYLMELGIGTPPVKIVAIADTGSDLVWIQCKPCDSCYNQTDPIFDSTKSSTFDNSVSCNDTICLAILPSSSCGDNLLCEYMYGYGGGSITFGNLARETFTFSSGSNNASSSIPGIGFGCSHSSEGQFTPNVDGLIGLGGGAASLVRQLDSSIHGKFSYCLVPYAENTTSILNMGDKAVVNGPGVVTIPMTSGNYTFYMISLNSITIGNDTIPYTPDDTTNIIVDSGTTITYIPDFALTKVIDAVSKTINLNKTKDPQNYLSLCYSHSVKDPPYPFPNITFNFDNQLGHDQVSVVLTATQTFIQSTDDVICLAMDYSGKSDNIAIFGNVAQQNMHVGYDLHANVISMAPADCSKLSSS
ncbi:aspartic proteinase CDR1-like [Dioscorea cayenensis subsp. rotundata]|uniref:Aspartic proteinase CDR1-like n=1 Tax=Dioscorea cayennensis subsp. rotundata TaxID=55577 RepID=A0AB40CQR9_DIOCR|nr:aspartic proteinase CDR1-like [Dioscorea cayenensis subsp. rotundata]